MPRVMKYFDKMLARFPEGTFERIEAVLGGRPRIAPNSSVRRSSGN